MNTIVLAVLGRRWDGGGTSGPMTGEWLERHLAARLDEVPVLRWRVKPVPFGIHHPVYVDDAGFRLDHHLSEVTLAPPGDMDGLDSVLAGLAGLCLERDRPLWQVVLVSGLAGGRQALVLRIHHCLMDGYAIVNVLSRLLSSEPAGPGEASDSPWAPATSPSPADLVARALRDQWRAGLGLPGLVARTWRGQGALRRRSARQGERARSGQARRRGDFPRRAARPAAAVPTTKVDTPPTIFNRAFGPARRFARTAFPLADLVGVKEAAVVSVNDVALAMVAGAVRGYLEARGALPERSLVAGVPVGLERAGAPPRTHGNHFSGMATWLATDVADPWGRLLAIGAGAREAKACLGLAGADLLPDWLDAIPPALAEPLLALDARRRRRRPDRVAVNLMVSNLRGPSRPWSLGPALVEEVYLGGPPTNGEGVNVVLWDYGSLVCFGILTAAESVASPGELAEGLERSLDELVGAARLRVTSEPEVASEPEVVWAGACGRRPATGGPTLPARAWSSIPPGPP